MSLYKTYNTFENYAYTLFLFQLFIIFFLFFARKGKKSIDLKGIEIKNNIVFYSNLILLIFCILLGKSGQTILSGNYGSLSSSSTPLYEYGLIFLSLVLLSKNNKKQMYISYIVFLVYCIRSFLYGGRIEIIMACLSIFSIDFKERFNKVIMIFLLLVGIQAINIMGDIRSGNEYIERAIDIQRPIVNNYTEVFYSSTVYIQVRNDERVNFTIPIKSINETILKVIDPGIGIIKDQYYPSTYSRSFSGYGGGGHIFSYFYFWFGSIGVILSSLIVAYIFNSLNFSNRSRWGNFWILMCFCTFPRWLVYSPILLIKLNIYATLIYFIFYKYHISLKFKIH